MARPKPVPERNANGETERVYHEIRQTLRVSGVPLIFRMLAGYRNILPLIWDELRPNLETREFENSADRIRARAVQTAQTLLSSNKPSILSGESQRYQIQRALTLYHYIDPKILLLTSALTISLHGETVGWSAVDSHELPLIATGIPPNMYAMELADPGSEPQLSDTFEEIKNALSLPAANSEYRTLALWPEYLCSAWARLRPLVKNAHYRRAAEELRQLSIHLARRLPLPIGLSLRTIDASGEDSDHVLRTVERFESLLPILILNNCFLLLEWFQERELVESPFPASDRQVPAYAEAQAV